jgi:hypothetical protein
MAKEYPSYLLGLRYWRYLLAILLHIIAASANAQDWSFDPRLSIGGEIDDNAQLTTRTDDVVELNGLLLEAMADIGYESESTTFLLTPLIQDRSYADDPVFDSTMIDVWMRYRFDSPRNTWRFDAWYNEDTVRRAERADAALSVDDPDFIPDDDTGLVQLRGDRRKLVLRPVWAFDWSNKSTSVVRFNYRDVTYEDVLILSDYIDMQLMLDYRLDISQKTTGFVAGTSRHYEADQVLGEFDTNALNVGFETLLSPTLRIRARIGAENVKSPVTGLDETRPIGELTFIRRLETIRLLAQYRRTVTSSGSGRMSSRDAFNLNFTRLLGERFDAGFGVRAYSTDPIALQPDADRFGRNYLQLTAVFSWNITRKFAFRTMYRYTWVDREILGETANSNQVMVWFDFRPMGIRQDR